MIPFTILIINNTSEAISRIPPIITPITSTATPFVESIKDSPAANDISQLSNALKEIGNHRGQFETRLALQQRHANAVPVSTFKYALVQALSG